MCATAVRRESTSLSAMRTAVLRVKVDPDGRLTGDDWDRGLVRLRATGRDVIAVSGADLAGARREVELVVDGFVSDDTQAYVDECARAFGTTASAGAVTYVSRGTDEDARGVLAAFDLEGDVERQLVGDDEVVTITLEPDFARTVPESRLHTALEAALNCEVRIVT